VLQQLAAPLTELFVRRVEAARNDAQLLDANMAQNGLTVNDCWTSIELCTQLFYSLTSQDLPEFFEDNMQVWMNAFLQVGSVGYIGIFLFNIFFFTFASCTVENARCYSYLTWNRHA
jgi:exportin-2 (importin alpha re-exporter)